MAGWQHGYQIFRVDVNRDPRIFSAKDRMLNTDNPRRQRDGLRSTNILVECGLCWHWSNRKGIQADKGKIIP